MATKAPVQRDLGRPPKGVANLEQVKDALEGAREALCDGTGESGGARRNAEWAQGFATFADHVARWRRRLLADPVTSGGLLVAVARERAEHVPGAVIGCLREGPAGTIAVR